MTVKRFEDLLIWQEARKLTKCIYEVTSKETFKRDFALTDQMRRSAVSVMANIAEGFERCNNKEFIQYLFIAKSSCGELRSHLYVAVDQRYLAEREHLELSTKAAGISTMVNNLIDYLKKTPIKGMKHK
jgi:four helix bundle protein